MKRLEKILDNLPRLIKKVQRVLAALTGLVLEIGTLIAVIKMVIESFQ